MQFTTIFSLLARRERYTKSAAWEALQLCRRFYPWRCLPKKVKDGKLD